MRRRWTLSRKLPRFPTEPTALKNSHRLASSEYLEKPVASQVVRCLALIELEKNFGNHARDRNLGGNLVRPLINPWVIHDTVDSYL